ncbi:hypothetical protein [Rhizobium sp. RHZ01]|uniref:hypothetical protein n=1 Tax=Rhizobium sp. RHZ01 TaxID=2769304 RepID=UPI00177EFAF1|nr:hypothetical protein [Rhizobium sp. RHZ01]MBD9447307.1 hypothetical protein [Rhizobium sp. RHZ01]
MSNVSELIAELLRAANEIQKLTDSQVQLLLFRSIVKIRELRESVGIPGSGTSRDAVVELYDLANEIGNLGEKQRTSALLHATDLIRTLRIVSESGTKLEIRQTEYAID